MSEKLDFLIKIFQRKIIVERSFSFLDQYGDTFVVSLPERPESRHFCSPITGKTGILITGIQALQCVTKARYLGQSVIFQCQNNTLSFNLFLIPQTSR